MFKVVCVLYDDHTRLLVGSGVSVTVTLVRDAFS
jgi:hypothetical protein